MTWSDELTKIRRYLRDPNGNIWAESLLRNLYNQVQTEIQERVQLLEDIEALRVPPTYQWSYIFDWEWSNIPTTETQYYQALRYHHQANLVCCNQWEAQNTNQIDENTPEEGDHYTQPWEAFMCTPGMPVKFRFPSNFHTMMFIAYDRAPIDYVTQREVTSKDPSWISRTGKTFAYFRPDELDNSFIPYPLPSTSFTDEISDDSGGMALFQNGDSLNQETGDIIQRDGTFLDSDTGIAVDIIEEANNFFMVYRAIPGDIPESAILNGLYDDFSFPNYLRKYIRYGVLNLAYKANTDGRIPSLEKYWEFRYELGIKFLVKFKAKRKSDRVYRLTSPDPIRRQRFRPRLPDGYPAI